MHEIVISEKNLKKLLSKQRICKMSPDDFDNETKKCHETKVCQKYFNKTCNQNKIEKYID